MTFPDSQAPRDTPPAGPVAGTGTNDGVPRPLVSVVVVNYNAWPDVEALVAALAVSDEVARGMCEILVVDNASDGQVPESLLTPPPGVRLILRRDNGGFAVGVNAGWRASRAPWILLLNPDVSVSPGLLERVVERVRRYEQGEPPGVVGFALRNPDGTPQHSVGRFPTLGRAFREQLIPRSRRKYQPVWSTRPGPVDWVTGACLLANARLLEALGGLDEDFFLYYEEVALCRSARRLGWRVEFDPSVEVVHLRPLQNRGVSPKLRVITRHSKLLYFRKHLPRWQFLALCAVVAAEARVKGAWGRLWGRSGEANAWRAIARVERELRAGVELNGKAVLALAESAATCDAAGIARPAGRSRPETERAHSRRT